MIPTYLNIQLNKLDKAMDYCLKRYFKTKDTMYLDMFRYWKQEKINITVTYLEPLETNGEYY